MAKPTLEDLKAEVQRQNEALADLASSLDGSPVIVPPSFCEAFDEACEIRDWLRSRSRSRSHSAPDQEEAPRGHFTDLSLPAVNFVNNFAPGTGLSDEALLAYCQSRIGGIDQQIDTQFSQQQAIQNATSAINDSASLFTQAAAPKPGMTLGQLDPCVDELKATYSQLDPNSQQAQEIQAQLTQLTALQAKFPTRTTKKTRPRSRSTPARARPSSLQSISKDLGSEAEMQMMTLQSLVSQRQTAVQMCTNMLSSLGDTQKSIAEKVGT